MLYYYRLAHVDSIRPFIDDVINDGIYSAIIHEDAWSSQQLVLLAEACEDMARGPCSLAMIEDGIWRYMFPTLQNLDALAILWFNGRQVCEYMHCQVENIVFHLPAMMEVLVALGVCECVDADA
jgi:hypothetical protein